MAQKPSKHQANAEFMKLQRANDAKKATSDYEAEAAALRAKTARLRAQRLARDAALAKTEPAPAKPKGKKKAKPNTLQDWLDGKAKEGRNS